MEVDPVTTAQHFNLHNQYRRGSNVQNIRYFSDSIDYKKKYQVSIYDKLRKQDEEKRVKKQRDKKHDMTKTKDNEKIKEINLDININLESFRDEIDETIRDDVSIISIETNQSTSNNANNNNIGNKKHTPLQLKKAKIKHFINSLSLSRPATKTLVDISYQKRVKAKFVSNPIIMDKIISNFDPLVKEDKKFLLTSALTLNKDIHKIVERHLYSKVSFESTYKLAQFLATLKNSKREYMKGLKNYRLSDYVVSIDLSSLKSGSDLYKKYYGKHLSNEDSFDEMSLATWRDWRMKDSFLYGDKMRTVPSSLRKRAISTTSIVTVCTTSSTTNNNEETTRTKKEIKKRKMNFSFIKKKIQFKKKNKSNKTATLNTQQEQYNNSNNGKFSPQHKMQKISESPAPVVIKHPLINFHLLKYKDNRDIPIGFIIHFLKLCNNLKYLNLDRLSISEDFLLLENKIHSKNMNIKEMINFFMKEVNIRFLSDTGINQFNLKANGNVAMLTFTNFFQIFVELLQGLDINLTKLSLKHCYFVQRVQVQDLLLNKFAHTKKQKKLHSNNDNNNKENDSEKCMFEVDFYKATMNKDYQWCNTTVKDWQEVIVLMFMCNLSDLCRNGQILLNKFSLFKDSENDCFFESQLMDINGMVDNKSIVNFKLCFNIARREEEDSYKVEHFKLKNRFVIQINIFLKIQKYYDINEFTKETDFLTFHENMSYLLLSQNIRKGNLDFRYYNILILCEYLLIRLNREYYERGIRNIGFNTFSM